MRNLRNDVSGSGVLMVAAIVLLIGLAILLLPMIIGWAVAYLVHIVTGEPEITGFWARWVIGIAVLIVASVFKPDVYARTADTVRGKKRDYWYNEYE